jgi:hypothetical protein
MNMIFGGIRLTLTRKTMKARCMEDSLYEGVALAAIVRTDTDTLIDIHTITGALAT